MSDSANINGWFTSFLNRQPSAQEDQYWQQEVRQKGLSSAIDSFSEAAKAARGNNLTSYQNTQWNNLIGQMKIPATSDRMYDLVTQGGTNTSLQTFLNAEMAPDDNGIVSNEQRQRANTITQLYSQGGAPAVADWYKEQGIGNYMATMQTANRPGKENGVQDGGAWGFIKDAAPIMAAVFGGGYALSGMLGAGAAGGAAAGAAGAGEVAGGTAAAGGAAASGGAGLGAGLGAAAADAAIPTVSVVGAAGGAGAGLGTATAVGGGLAAGGLASMGGGGSSPQADPNIPQVVVNGNTGASGSSSLGNMMNPALGSAGAMLTPDQVSGPTPTAGLGDSFPINGASSTGSLPSIPGVPSGSSGSSTGLPAGMSLSDLIKGVGSAVSGYTDYKMNQADKDYYQQLMDKMMGMYNPGTPEAGLMEQKMRAQDAAAGRNSQYGVRATNLAAMLADQRSKIMTSPAFEKMAEASRGHYDSSLAGLSSILGGATTSGTAMNGLLNSAGSAITNSSWGQSLSDWFKAAGAPER